LRKFENLSLKCIRKFNGYFGFEFVFWWLRHSWQFRMRHFRLIDECPYLDTQTCQNQLSTTQNSFRPFKNWNFLQSFNTVGQFICIKIDIIWWNWREIRLINLDKFLQTFLSRSSSKPCLNLTSCFILLSPPRNVFPLKHVQWILFLLFLIGT
jgi:hypothetical protein